MRTRLALLILLGSAAAGGAALALDDGPRTPAAEKAAREAEAAAVKLGESTYKDLGIGAGEKSCSSCHDKKPELSLKGVVTRFPRYDDEAGKVITLQEKFVQMQTKRLKAKKILPLGDRTWTALEIYLKGLK